MFHLQHFVRGPLYMFRYLMPVSWAEKQSAQDQHVERALQQSNPVGEFLGHGVGRYSTQNRTQLGRRTTLPMVRTVFSPQPRSHSPTPAESSGSSGSRTTSR